MLSLLGGKAGVWTPRRLRGLQLWLVAGRLALADGAAASLWPDLSGRGWNASQATAGLQPVYRAGVVNNRSAVRFDDSDDVMNLPAGALGMARNVGGVSVAVVIAYGKDGNSSPIFIASGVDNTRAAIGSQGGCVLRMVLRRLDGDGAAVSSGGSYVVGQPLVQVAVVDFAGATAALYKNGAQVAGTPAGLTAGHTSDTDSTVVSVGYAGGSALGSDLAEVIVCNVAWTAVERRCVERYLGRKWGVGVT